MSWEVGKPVRLTFEDGRTAQGQVWAPAHVPNYVWVGLDIGRFVAVNVTRGLVYDEPSGERLGAAA